jgi:AAA15 family ATPase/GTPase
MIKEIKIENFKSIQSLNLELGRLNVFIGANGSGKSNILEAIALSSAAVHKRLINGLLYAKGVRKTDTNFLKSGFDKQKIEDDIHINLKFIEDEFYFSVFINHNNKKPSLPLSVVHSVFSNSRYMSYEMETYRENSLPSNESYINEYAEKKAVHEAFLNDFLIFSPENYFLRRFEEDTQTEPLGIRGEGLFSHIVKIFKNKPAYFSKINQHLQLLDWFQGFEIPNDLIFSERRIKIKDQFLNAGLQYIDQRSANEGFLYLLFYLTLFISDETPNFFAIDNIDNAMNPKLGSELIRVLSKLAKEHNKQTILTTHNPSVLDGLDLNDDEQRLFVVYRNGDGHTKIKRVFKKEMPEGIAPMALSEMFSKGIIGGLPKNF